MQTGAKLSRRMLEKVIGSLVKLILVLLSTFFTDEFAITDD